MFCARVRMCSSACVYMRVLCVLLCTLCGICVYASHILEPLIFPSPNTFYVYFSRSYLVCLTAASPKKCTLTRHPLPSQKYNIRTLPCRAQASGEAAGLHDVAWISNPFSPYTPGDTPRLDIVGGAAAIDGVGLGVSDSVPSLSDENTRGKSRVGGSLRVRRSRSRVA